jgi:uncharacterized membrane protein
VKIAAFAIYVLNMAAIIAFYPLGYSIESPLAVIALCIGAFALKNICKDECLATHFAYQSKTNFALFVYAVVVVCGSFLLAYFGETVDEYLNLALAYLLVYTIIAITIGVVIWFFYRNVKGLICLIKDTRL